MGERIYSPLRQQPRNRPHGDKWRTANKKPVENVDLWKELLDAARPHVLDWRWIRGRGSEGGEDAARADALAHEALLSIVPAPMPTWGRTPSTL